MGKCKRSPRLSATWDHVAIHSLAPSDRKYTQTSEENIKSRFSRSFRDTDGIHVAVRPDNFHCPFASDTCLSNMVGWNRIRKGGEVMRIIAGSRKGIRLKAVPGSETRPTSDRVKEALFQMIGPYFQGGTGVDLYAGSGALGMEALSRGIDEMYFSDTSGAAIKVIRENARKCHFEDQAHIYKQGAVRMAKKLLHEKRKCSLILLDPPYKQQQLERDITLIQDLELVTPETVIVAEHASSLNLAQEIGNFSKSRTKTFGDTQISIFTTPNMERNEQG